MGTIGRTAIRGGRSARCSAQPQATALTQPRPTRERKWPLRHFSVRPGGIINVHCNEYRNLRTSNAAYTANWRHYIAAVMRFN